MRNQTFLITLLHICTPIKNASTLSSFLYRTNTRVKSFKISGKDILSIIKSLDPTKTHGCDNLSNKMIQICNELITISLKLIFDQSLKKRKISRNLESNKCSPCTQKRR